MEVRCTSERGTLPRSFGDLVPVLRDQPLVFEREYPRIHPSESDGQPITTGKLPS